VDTVVLLIMLLLLLFLLLLSHRRGQCGLQTAGCWQGLCLLQLLLSAGGPGYRGSMHMTQIGK
jgi:hypothetical protein